MKKQEWNDGYYHEAMDRLHVVMCTIEDHIVEHPGIKKSKVSKKVKKAQALLSDAYQDVGHASLEAENKTERTLNKPVIEEGKQSVWDESRIDAIGQNGNTGEHYTKPHPLLNPDSPHYKILGDESIEQFEKMFTVDELKAWAKLSYYKYMFRLGKKDNIESELKKMKTYEDYYNYLNNQ